MHCFRPWLALVLIAAPIAAVAEEPVDLAMVTRIRDEGLNHSQVMDTAWHLTDAIGPRLTNSPQFRQAAEWTRATLAGWGLANAHLEPYEFGRGWSFSGVQVSMVKPVEALLLAYPTAWTPGTEGPVRGPVVRATLETDDDLAKARGTLRGKIVLLDAPRELKLPDDEQATRFTEQSLQEIEQYRIPTGKRPDWRAQALKMITFGPKLRAFLASEGVLAAVGISQRDGGLVTVGGSRAFGVGENAGVPSLIMAAEHYDRLCRLLDHHQEVELEVAVQARFWEDDTKAADVVAEIPGSDLRDQVVMVGAHLDSWHAGTGATDDAAGCAVVMEAMRILKALGVTPRRTIRIALWSGEEQGLDGSRAYVAQHFAARPEPTDPEQKALPDWARTGPLQLKPEHAKLAAYFNVDNGGGKIRGIYAQENAAVVPIFSAWLAPFADLGATAVTMRDTHGTDHLSFDAVGLPGFQFIQDELDYDSRTHHTEMDVYDRLQPADLMQASVIVASFLYDAAQRAQMLPRKPLPADEPHESPKSGQRPSR